MTEEELNILSDIAIIENSKMFVNEKKYYLKLIDTLKSINYYKNRQSFKELWSKSK